MQGIPEKSADEMTRRVMLRLFMLRNLTILGAGAGIAVAHFGYELELPLPPLLLILGLLAVLNVSTLLRLQTRIVTGNGEIFMQLLLDIAGITSLFYYTGGAGNPFVWFYLLPLIIAATILPRGYTWSMAAISITCYSALFFFNAPLSRDGMHHDGGFQLHVFGMWLGFVISAGFVAVIIVDLAHSLRERERKLAETREQILQNEHLVALGTLAAGAAHELGTPLGTMAILTAELEQEYTAPALADLRRKLGILRRQVDRCKDALSVVSASGGASRAESGHRMAVRKYLDSVLEEWQRLHPHAGLKVQIPEQATAATIIAERTLTQALVNVLNNAAEASPEEVSVEARWSAAELVLTIEDRGPGLSDEILEQLGRQPVTTKQTGLGVGLYLAQATIRRLGGNLHVCNRNQGGTRVHITVPLLESRMEPS